MDKDVIGKRVRRQREALNLTRDEFAERSGISPQFLAEIENGKKGMSAETLYKICNRTGVSADYLLLGKHTHITDGFITPAMEALSRIPSEHFEQVEELLQIMMDAVETSRSKPCK